MVKIVINNVELLQCHENNYSKIIEAIEGATALRSSEFYLMHNGAKLLCTPPPHPDAFNESSEIHLFLRLFGGKGGFGSMLRAIGAQIEKTTNREACRDLSGRRLRDINEEKRLKAWLEKQSEREREAEERKKRKIEKLLAVPKHEFKDEEYEEARSKLTEKVNDAVEEGFKKTQPTKKDITTDECESAHGSKRKAAAPSTSTQAKKKKPALWIGDDISDDSDSDSSDEEPKTQIKQKIFS